MESSNPFVVSLTIKKYIDVTCALCDIIFGWVEADFLSPILRGDKYIIHHGEIFFKTFAFSEEGGFLEFFFAPVYLRFLIF